MLNLATDLGSRLHYSSDLLCTYQALLKIVSQMVLDWTSFGLRNRINPKGYMKPHRTAHKQPRGKGQAPSTKSTATTRSRLKKANKKETRQKHSVSKDKATAPPEPVVTTPVVTESAPDPATKKKCKCCQCCCRKKEDGEEGCCSKCCRCCSKCTNKVCPYFPLCWNIPLLTTLQFLSIIDLFVSIGSICLWLYFHQFGPFSERIASANTTFIGQGAVVPPSMHKNDPNYYKNIGRLPPRKNYVYKVESFHETTTELGPPIFHGAVIDIGAESVRYSKIAYLNSKFLQDVEEGCGTDYYVENLFGHKLNITRELFYDILYVSYISEGISMLIDSSILILATAFFLKQATKIFLMFLWISELALIWTKIWICIAMRSQRLCIVQYGLGPGIRGVEFLTLFLMLPVMLFRIYKSLVYSFFVRSFFTPKGDLRGEDNSQEQSLRAYIKRQEELMGMDKERELSSSEEDDVEHL